MNWRRNATSLSDNEKVLFISAVKALKHPYNPKPSTGPTNLYDQYVAWHYIAGNKPTPDGDPYRTAAHSGPAFFPWHREFIRRFELDLQKTQTDIMSPYVGVTLPYWNWAEDTRLPDPKSAPIWKNFIGGDGDPNDSYIVKGIVPPDIYGNPFAVGNWRIADGDGNPSSQPGNPQGALQRALGKDILTLPTLDDVNNAFSEFPYDQWPWNPESSNPNNTGSFRNKLEGWAGLEPELHNRVHVWVGGSMSPLTSPNDPVFFLHHCYVDRIWNRWQIGFMGTFDYPDDGTITTVPQGGQRIVGHNRNDRMYPWNEKTVSNVLPSLEMGVEYDPGNHAITAVAWGSGNLEVFWIGRDGSVNGRSYVNQDQSWGNLYQISGPGSASVPSGSITATYNQQENQLHIWWTRPDSSVEHIFGGFIDGILNWVAVTRSVFRSSTSGGIATTYYLFQQMFCMGYDSKVYWEYWNGSNWVSVAVPSMKWSSTSSGLAAVTRSTDYMDVFWIEGDGSVKGQSYSWNPNVWGSPYQIADPGSAWGSSIVAVSRDTDKIDVWWIGPTDSNRRAQFPYTQYGYVYTNSFADGQWKGTSKLRAFASFRGGLAAVVKSPNGMEMYCIYDGGVYGMSWNSNGWGNPDKLYGPSASTSGGLAALIRTSNDIDVLWIGPDNSVVGTNLYYQQGLLYNQTLFNALTFENPSFSDYAASTGLPSDSGI